MNSQGLWIWFYKGTVMRYLIKFYGISDDTCSLSVMCQYSTDYILIAAGEITLSKMHQIS